MEIFDVSFKHKLRFILSVAVGRVSVGEMG